MKKRLECDISMASKKGYIPCNNNCSACHAAIKINKDGNREHLTKTKKTKEWVWD